MPAHRKHSPETRKRIFDMYKAGRKGRAYRGTYTLEQISEATGVEKYYCWKIANAKV
jgi:hypothetical protein